MWKWLDNTHADIERGGIDHSSEVEMDVNADPWWEALVAELFAREGKVNLA